jgi:ribosome-associated toxin RatA of RatAB toxin-antitoxin module
VVKVEGRRIIRAPVQKVFQLVSRMDTSPRVTGLWLTSDLVERKSNSLTVQYRGYFAGLPVESLQRAILHPPNRIEFRQSRGHLKTFRGNYVLKPIEGDTEIALTLEAEVGITLISEQAARLVLHQFIERSLEKFKLTAERDLPRVVRKAVANGAKQQVAQVAQADVATVMEQPETGPAMVPGASTPAAPIPIPPKPTQQAAPQPGGQPGGRRRRRRRRRRRGGGRGTPSGPPPSPGGSG